MARSSSSSLLPPSAKVPASITAAGKRIDLAKQAEKRQAMRAPEEWQIESWAYFDEVPELKFAFRYTGNAMSKLRTFVGIAPQSPDDDPIPVDAKPVENSNSDADAKDDAVPAVVIPPELAAAAKAELARLRGPLGGLSEILRELNVNLEVAAECYLIGVAPRDIMVTPEGGGAPVPKVTEVDGTAEQTDEAWDIKSISEVKEVDHNGQKRMGIFDRPGQREPSYVLDPEKDTLIRIWSKHPRYSALPDTNMRALLFECQILQTLNQQLLAEGNSHNSAGLLLVPSELSFGSEDATEDEADEDGKDTPDVFTEALGTAIAEPIGDPSSPYSVAPLVVRGPAEYLEAIRHLTLSRDTSADLDMRIEKRIRRLANGVNLPPEVLLGHDSTTFSNGKQIDQDEFDDYLQPRAVLCVDALTEAFLRPNLLDSFPQHKELIEQLVVWFDAVDLIGHPDREANADAAYDRNEISGAAYRAAKGYDDDDAPTDDEILRRLGARKGILTADLTYSLLSLFEGMPEYEPLVDAPPPLDPNMQGENAAAAFDPDNPTSIALGLAEALGCDAHTAYALEQYAAVLERQARAQALPGKALAASAAPSPGRRLLDIDRELRTRLLIAADDAVTRATERAGNRLQSRVKGDAAALIRNVPAADKARTLGRALIAAAGVSEDDLVKDAWAELERQYRAWGAQAQEEAINVASELASGFTKAERAGLKLRQAADLDEAWGWLREALDSFTSAGLFDLPVGVDIGEWDPTLKVPVGMIRQAMARAGGASAFSVDGVDAWVALLPDGRPVGGIGTGELVRSALTENGAGVEGYTWVYGPGFRRTTFHPHLSLDGVSFVNFDDPVLAVSGSFPARDHYMPGDHRGCQCDFEPAIIPAPSVIGGIGLDTSE